MLHHFNVKTFGAMTSAQSFFRSETRQGQYVFDLPTVSNSIGFTTIDLLNHIQNLKVWNFERKTYFHFLLVTQGYAYYGWQEL